MAFTLYKVKMPKTIQGACTLDKRDGKIIVALNADLTEDEQAAAFLHEMLHLYHGDLNKENTTAREIEEERQEEMQRLLRINTAQDYHLYRNV